MPDILSNFDLQRPLMAQITGDTAHDLVRIALRLELAITGIVYSKVPQAIWDAHTIAGTLATLDEPPSYWGAPEAVGYGALWEAMVIFEDIDAQQRAATGARPGSINCTIHSPEGGMQSVRVFGGRPGERVRRSDTPFHTIYRFRRGHNVYSLEESQDDGRSHRNLIPREEAFPGEHWASEPALEMGYKDKVRLLRRVFR